MYVCVGGGGGGGEERSKTPYVCHFIRYAIWPSITGPNPTKFVVSECIAYGASKSKCFALPPRSYPGPWAISKVSASSFVWYAISYQYLHNRTRCWGSQNKFTLLHPWKNPVVGSKAFLYVSWLFLVMPWVGLRCVIVAFPDYTHLLFDYSQGLHLTIIYCITFLLVTWLFLAMP